MMMQKRMQRLRDVWMCDIVDFQVWTGIKKKMDFT